MEEKINQTEYQKVTPRRFKTILADPPWGVSSQRGKNSHRSAESHYALMSLERIKAMPVQDLVEENSHLYLWIPNALLQEGLDVIKAWGFTYRSMLVWIKPKLGLGVYVRNAHETLLFATRGKCPVKFRAQGSWVFAPYQPPHSHKPEEIFCVVERMSNGPYLELFARRRPRTLGWDVWGNEIDSDIIIPGYPVPKYSAKALREER